MSYTPNTHGTFAHQGTEGLRVYPAITAANYASAPSTMVKRAHGLQSITNDYLRLQRGENVIWYSSKADYRGQTTLTEIPETHALYHALEREFQAAPEARR